MASNYVSDGNTLTFVAPQNLKGGVPVAINDVMLVPLHGAAKDTVAVGRLSGVWRLPTVDGLKAGSDVAWLNDSLVAAGTAQAVAFGKLMTDSVGGLAEALLIQR